MRGRLPPLNPVRAFEAAGRLRSIRRAAEELCVTPGAVSRQVKILESQLGVVLFRRTPQAVVLTALGEQYLDAISPHLDGLVSATEQLTGSKGKQIVKVRAYTTFAMKWLIPRLSRFHALGDEYEVHLTTSLGNIDFEREDIDAAIRLGDGSWAGCESMRLVPNKLAPVHGRKLMCERPIKSVDDLSSHSLLHSIARPHDWELWLKFVGSEIPSAQGQRYESSALAYQAALEGHGVAMAQLTLIEREIADGTLVQPLPQVLDRGEFTYYLVWPPGRMRHKEFRVFKDWLAGEVSQA